jgi:hypothetical protein
MILLKQGAKKLKSGGLLYDEKQLVSFGNYLLSKERRKMVSKLTKGSVGHWDTENWKHKEKSNDA